MQNAVPDTFLTVGRAALAEPPKTKGSRFIGEAIPVATEEDAMAELAAVRKREHAATHHVWAFRLSPDGRVFRYSDDGEPNGSAGLPVYRELEGRGLAHVLVVVTRYYGGTKLGTGGLARAYAEAAGLALDAAPRKSVVLRTPVVLRFGFEDTAPAMHTLGQFDAPLESTAYSAEGTTLRVRVRRSEVEALRARFTEALGGRGTADVPV